MMREYETKLALMKKCRKYIDDHLDEDIDLKALAKHFDYEYPTFRKFFMQVGEYSPYNYIRLRRMNRAAQALREGKTIPEAMELSRYETLSGFNKAFYAVYGVSSSVFAATRGRVLMSEPEFQTLPSFYIVGSPFKAEEELTEEEGGAFWIAKDFPVISDEDFAKIGGGIESLAVWAERSDGRYYLLGPQVPELKFVPAQMDSEWVPGGGFLAFNVPHSRDNSILFENVRVTWYYALRQWLPESDYERDENRTPFEFYFTDENGIDRNRIFIPVKPRGAQT